MTDLDDLAAELKSARDHVVATLVAASGYIDKRAAEGDPEAVELSRLIGSAFDTLIAVNIVGVTAIHEQENPNV